MSTTTKLPTVLDFKAPGNRRALLITIQSILLVITTAVVAGRFYARALLVRQVGIDDWLILLAYLFAIAVFANTIVMTNYGWTFHVQDVPQSDAIIATAWEFQIIFSATVSIIKLSILFFYLRLTASLTYKRIIWVGIGIVFIWLIAFETGIALLCYSPTNPVIGPNGHRSPHCISKDPIVAIHGITNTLTDFCVLAIPIPMLWNLQLPMKRKIGLISVFSVGFIVCICGMIRLIYSLTAQNDTDYTYRSYNLWVWAILEIDIGIICASIPSLKVILIKSFPSLFDVSLPSQAYPTPGFHSTSKQNSSHFINKSGNGQAFPLNTINTKIGSGESEESIVRV